MRGDMDFSHISSWLLYALLAWLVISAITTPIIGLLLAAYSSESVEEHSIDLRSRKLQPQNSSIMQQANIPKTRVVAAGSGDAGLPNGGLGGFSH